MDGECNLRLQALELNQKALKEQIESHDDNLDELTNSINSIKDTLNSIKYTLFGAFLVYLLQMFGLKEFLNMVM